MDSKEPVGSERPGAPAGTAELAPWPGFAVARLPRILFGSGTTGQLGSVVREFGRRALVVVRGPGFTDSLDWTRLLVAMETAGVQVDLESVSGEPSPELVDGIVARHRGSGPSGRSGAVSAPGSNPGSGSAAGPAPIDVVVGIGGGSVLDTDRKSVV